MLNRQVTTYPVKGLKDSFANQKIMVANRSSAVFPVYLRKGTDVHIVFLNYWTIKNNIPKEMLSVNIRIYNELGNLIKINTLEKLENHNQISIKNLLQENKEIENFDGSVHIEIISTKNLRFQFPGIIAVYQSNNMFSAVHSAGRVKNSDEVQKIAYTKESNWVCKIDKNITPFFHYFNGPVLPQKKDISVALYKASNNNLIISKDIDISDIPELGSRIFTVEKIFPQLELKEEYYMSVLVEHNCIFPRLVTGNLFKDCNFLETTHSFPFIEKIDHIKTDKEKGNYQSILCGYTSKDLCLDMKVFPTNCEGEFSADYFSQKYGDSKLTATGKKVHFSVNDLKAMQHFRLSENEQFLELGIKSSSVPSRFNATFSYKVKKTKNNLYSTNIASGAHSCDYPPKRRHWGHGCLSNGYETAILIRNTSHEPTKTKDGQVKIILYCKQTKFEHEFKIKAESSVTLKLSEIIPKDNFAFYKDNNFLSWFMEFDIPNCDSKWVSYRKTDGAIFGDHCF